MRRVLCQDELFAKNVWLRLKKVMVFAHTVAL